MYNKDTAPRVHTVNKPPPTNHRGAEKREDDCVLTVFAFIRVGQVHRTGDNPLLPTAISKFPTKFVQILPSCWEPQYAFQRLRELEF